MLIILFYDIPKKKNKNNYLRIKKIAEQYLKRVQYSVFEGELSEAIFKEMTIRLEDAVDKEIDSIILYSFKSKYYSERKILGIDKKESMFI